jgi:peptidoglycan/LPS O-acetylase OafA/YrhL
MNAVSSDVPAARNPEAGRIPVIDGVRAVAIVLVIVFHGSRTLAGNLHSRALANFAREGGHLGVDLFFVLSGYLISSILLAEHKRTGSIDLRRFYLRRTRRIFPAYYLYLLCIGGLAIAHVLQVSLTAWLLGITYLTDYSLGHSAVWIEHGWSLAIEEQFYLFWPALIIALGVGRAYRFALGCIVVLPFVRLATYVVFPHQRDFIDVMFHTRLDMLMFGCALAIAVSRGLIPLDRFAGRTGTTAMQIALAALVLGVLAATKFHGAYLFTVGYTVTGLATATLLLYLVSHPDSPGTKLLGLRPVTWLGRISYSLYLWQQLFLTPENQTILGRFPINVCAAVLCAAASYYFVERRFFKPVPVERSTLVPPLPAAG